MKIEVWGTGRPLTGFTEDAVLTSARKLFPTKKSQHIARFIAGKRFLITRVNNEEGAQKLIEGLAKSGIEADTKGPPPPPPDGDPAAATAAVDAEDTDDEELFVEETDDQPSGATTPVKSSSFLSRNRGPLIVGAIVAVIAVAGGVALVSQRQQAKARESVEQAIAESKARASQAAKREAEADASRKAADAAAEKARAAAEEADRQAKKEVAVTEMTSTYANGDYPNVIAMSERFDLMYGPDQRVTKLEQDATFNLKEGARRGNFAAILDAPIKGSARFDALRRWAQQVQERAKPEH